MRLKFIFFSFVFFVSTGYATLADTDFSKYEIIIDEAIPNTDILKKNLMLKNSEYNRHFSFRWNMPKEFDLQFKNTYKMLAADERHLSNMTENQIVKMLQKMPKEVYPYIGPYLHTIPQLSGRVLSLPGIKETKNQFPKQISERFKDVENIEYASPHLYINLAPEELKKSLDNKEYPQMDLPEYQPLRRQNINPEFLKNIVLQTPLEDYAEGKKAQEYKGIRHYIADENTPLSGADVSAFLTSLEDLQQFNRQNQAKFISVVSLIEDWEEQNGAKKGFYLYKQAANPCHSIVRNVKWNNKSLEFQNIIGKNGFGADDWALICEKTLKSYRRANISSAMAMMLYGMKTNQHLQYYEAAGLSTDEMQMLEDILGAVVEMYNASNEDVKTIKPYMNEIYKSLPKTNSYFLGTPLLFP